MCSFTSLKLPAQENDHLHISIAIGLNGPSPAMFPDLGEGRYTLQISASNNWVDRTSYKRRIHIPSDPTVCCVYLINDGISVKDGEIVVEFSSTGNPESFLCKTGVMDDITCKAF